MNDLVAPKKLFRSLWGAPISCQTCSNVVVVGVHVLVDGL